MNVYLSMPKTAKEELDGEKGKWSKYSAMKRFIRENKWISCILLLAIVIIISYLASLDMPEWFKNAGDVFNLFYNLAIGYCVSFIFYGMRIRLTVWRDLFTERIIWSNFSLNPQKLLRMMILLIRKQSASKESGEA